MKAALHLLFLVTAFVGSAATSPRRNVVLFLGDSLTAGYGVAAEEAYPALLGRQWKAQGRSTQARNAGISGATTAGILESLDWHLTPDVALVFLEAGANDGLRGLKLTQTEKNLSLIIKRCRASGAQVALAGMKIPPNYGPEYTAAFERLYLSLARRHHLKRLPFLLEGVAGRPELNIEDSIHPNAKGHEKIAQLVGAFLDKEKLLP